MNPPARAILLISLITLPILVTQSQADDSRLALVIGNAAYKNGGALKNPVNDANLMAKTLAELGFDVIKVTDAGLEEMQKAFKQFAGKLDDYQVALFFYAGHGMQVDGENYLIRVDANLEQKMSIEFEAFNVGLVNRYFSYNMDKMNIIILDACRNNPFRSWSRGGAQGFTAVKEQGAGTIIGFATREGETASDGDGSNGLYTKHLVKQMKIPQGINDVFLNTRIEVLNESNRQQVPQEWNMLTGNFHFSNSDTAPTDYAITDLSASVASLDDINDRELVYLGTSSENFKDGPGSFSDIRDSKTYSNN